MVPFVWENISGFFTFTYIQKWVLALKTGADLGGGCKGCATPPLPVPLRYSGFPSPRKPTFSNSNSTRNQVGEEPLCGCTTSKSLFILCINFIYLFYVSLQGQYSPSYILCPETYNWIPIEQCRPKIALAKYSRLDDLEEGNACIIF